MGHSLITNHFFQSMLFNLAMLDRAHPFRWRGRPLRGQANKAQQPRGLTGVICQAPSVCRWWSHRWIYPKVNGDSPHRPWARHSDYRPSLRVALIDVACVYLFTMPLNLWIQRNVGRRGTTLGAERERERVLHGLIYAMLCRAIERQHRWRVWDETARWGGGCGFALGSEGRLDESHAFLTLGAVHHAIRITNTQQKGWEERFRHTGENRMYFRHNNVEPIGDARWWTCIPALPHPWWRAIPSRDNHWDSSGSDSLFHLIPIQPT